MLRGIGTITPHARLSLGIGAAAAEGPYKFCFVSAGPHVQGGAGSCDKIRQAGGQN
jgi:hypothetical protein